MQVQFNQAIYGRNYGTANQKNNTTSPAERMSFGNSKLTQEQMDSLTLKTALWVNYGIINELIEPTSLLRRRHFEESVVEELTKIRQKGLQMLGLTPEAEPGVIYDAIKIDFYSRITPEVKKNKNHALTVKRQQEELFLTKLGFDDILVLSKQLENNPNHVKHKIDPKEKLWIELKDLLINGILINKE